MSDNVETMASYEVPWHGKGVRLPEEAVTSAVAIEAAGLDWEVAMRPIYLSDNTRIPNKKALVRVTDKTVYQIFTDKYVPLQNRDAFKFFDQIVGEGEAIYHTAGSLNGGRQIWILAKLPGIIRVLGEDVVEKYLLLMNSHDGSSQIRTAFTPVRVVCQNTLNMALGSATRTVKTKHLGRYEEKFQSAAELMGIAIDHFDALQVVADMMAATRITAVQLKSYIAMVFPLPEPSLDTALDAGERHELAKRLVEEKRSKMLELAEVGAGANVARGTAWGAFNSAGELLDHYYRNHRDENNRLRDIWFGDIADRKQRAWDLAVELVKESLQEAIKPPTTEKREHDEEL